MLNFTFKTKNRVRKHINLDSNLIKREECAATFKSRTMEDVCLTCEVFYHFCIVLIYIGEVFDDQFMAKRERINA